MIDKSQHRTINSEQHEPHKNPGVNSSEPENKHVFVLDIARNLFIQRQYTINHSVVYLWLCNIYR